MSEIYSSLLLREGIAHNLLNANNAAREAQIIAESGQKGAVTVATSMAGRGTDIKLGPGVADLGGLVVIGTERMENQRIDLQIRGRSGRQGDPGISKFFISLEDGSGDQTGSRSSTRTTLLKRFSSIQSSWDSVVSDTWWLRLRGLAKAAPRCPVE